MFKNRKEAGERLAGKLERFRSSNPLLLAIPKGGVSVYMSPMAAEFLPESAISLIIEEQKEDEAWRRYP